MNTPLQSPTIVGLGEVLWDIFPDSTNFGGAPANFASHAAALGASAHMVSAVGQDTLGDDAITALRDRNLSADHVARTSQPTGAVYVTLDAAGKPTYDISQNAAWDNIPWSNALAQLAASTHAVCFGTLGQRSPTSAKTIHQFVNQTPATALRIFDINLRPPFHTDQVILDSLQIANVLKLSDEEWPTLTQLCNINPTDEHAAAQQLAERFSLHTIALTRGPNGATLFQLNQTSHAPAVPTQVADTVGAGDAYTAALAHGLLRNSPLDIINQHATRLAAYVCSQHGATPDIPTELR